MSEQYPNPEQPKDQDPKSIGEILEGMTPEEVVGDHSITERQHDAKAADLGNEHRDAVCELESAREALQHDPHNPELQRRQRLAALRFAEIAQDRFQHGQ